jgi:hypothetical protein
MNNVLQTKDPFFVTATAFSDSKYLEFQINFKITELIWNQLEPERQKWKKWTFLYDSKLYKQPYKTYVSYILNSEVIKNLSGEYWKKIEWLHIHKCKNTKWKIICYPEKLSSQEETIKMIENWISLVYLYLISKEINNINEFVDKNDPYWVKKLLDENSVNVVIEETVWK